MNTIYRYRLRDTESEGFMVTTIDNRIVVFMQFKYFVDCKIISTLKLSEMSNQNLTFHFEIIGIYFHRIDFWFRAATMKIAEILMKHMEAALDSEIEIIHQQNVRRQSRNWVKMCDKIFYRDMFIEKEII